MISRRTLLALCAAPVARARASGQVRVGLSLPLTGVQSAVAEELLQGYELAFAAGREAGVDVYLQVIDDKSQADKTAAAMRAFASDPSVIATSGIVGTPHAKAAIPVARSGGLPIVGLRSGASELRDGGPLVWHLRASYEAELTRTIGSLAAIHRRVAVIASNDAFGIAAAKHASKQCQAHGISHGEVVMADRNGADIDAATERALKGAEGPTALLLLMITKPAARAVIYAREHSFLGAICTMSFTAGAELASMGAKNLRGLGLVTAFPLPRTAHDETSERFKTMAARTGAAGLTESLNAAEGWWYGSATVSAIARGGATRAGVANALAAAPPLKLGGEHLAFDAEKVGRQFLRLVHFDVDGVLRA